MAALWAAFETWAATPLADTRADDKAPIQIPSELGGV